LSLHANKIQLN